MPCPAGLIVLPLPHSDLLVSARRDLTPADIRQVMAELCADIERVKSTTQRKTP